MGEGIKNCSYKKIKLVTSFPVLILIPLLMISSFFFTPRFFNGVFIHEYHEISTKSNNNATRCSTMANNSICCDRTDYHSDICFARGEVRTHPSSSSILLVSPNTNSSFLAEEKIRPYTRKWESIIMDKIPELRLKSISPSDSSSLYSQCDVKHNVTAIFFSLGGYTGNIFHSFSNGLVPLYITSQHLNRQVVFVVLEYRHWWYTKYQEIISQLSNYPLIDFSNDRRTHCFPGAIVGLRFHDTLAIDPSQMKNNKNIIDFHHMLDNAYNKHHKYMKATNKGHNPRLVIVARKGSRAIENEEDVVELAKEVGFTVEVLRPKSTMQLSMIYEVLSSCDVMMGVHGAALTHFLFLRPGSLFIQIVPIGLNELAQLCFGEAAVEMGIKYEEYKILPAESSLYRKYGEADETVRDPERVKAKGWKVTKEVYLEGQNVTLDISRLRYRLVEAFQHAARRRSQQN